MRRNRQGNDVWAAAGKDTHQTLDTQVKKETNNKLRFKSDRFKILYAREIKKDYALRLAAMSGFFLGSSDRSVHRSGPSIHGFSIPASTLRLPKTPSFPPLPTARKTSRPAARR